ncbi:single-stranded DNA-binding protein [Salmonella phage CRW-SP2]|nr:single-stranded DNA-binding protein [Salmonella phage CRW-SP2]
MSSLFERLKQTRGQQTDAMQQRLVQQGQKSGFQKDPRIWKWTWNKSGISENIIRFLPIPLVDIKAKEEGTIDADQILTPCAMVMKNQFQGPGGWYIENSPQTFGKDDPVRDHDRPLWQQQKATNDEKLKTILKGRLPDTKYYANILVINDANVPENNGKVFLLEFGNAIKKIIDSAQNPKFPTDPKFDPFDLWEGANLNLKLFSEEKSFGNWTGPVPNFSKVVWENPAPLGDEKYMEDVWSREHSLFEFFNPANFKSYEELEKRLRKVLAIPEGQPLVETGAGSVAHAPTEPVDNTPAQTAQNSLVQQQAQPSNAQQAVQQQVVQTQPDATQTSSIDQFEQFLKESK